MSKHVFRIEDGKFGLSLTDPGTTDPCTATLAQYTDFGCQITDGALNASPNTTTETVPATWCAPEETITNVGATSFSVDLGYLQDPDVVDGLSRFMFEHDAEQAWFYIGMDGDDPPKAIGKLTLSSGTIGGPGRTTLTASVSLPVDGKPGVCFGDATSSAPVVGYTDVSATYPAAAAAADLATLKADAVSGDAGTGAPYNDGTGTEAAFAAGDAIKLADASLAYWDGAAWQAGVAP